MTVQASFSGSRFISVPYILFTLASGVLLIALGLVIHRIWPEPVKQKLQLTVLCVSGFSWDRVIPLNRQGGLPFLASLFLQKGSYGDIISKQSACADAATAAFFTGRLPEKHQKCRAEDFSKLLSDNRLQIPVWQELAAQGEKCIVVGLPAADDNNIISAHEESPLVTETALREHMQDITGGGDLPPDLLRLLRECIGSDLERMRRAADTAAAGKQAHLFAYFAGLGRWQKRLSADTDSLPDLRRSALIDSYYKFFDNLLALLQHRLGGQDTFVLISEPGYPAPGFLYATGRHIREGTEPLQVKPADIAPTLIYLTGNPVLRTMQGAVIFGMLEEPFYFQQKLAYK